MRYHYNISALADYDIEPILCFPTELGNRYIWYPQHPLEADTLEEAHRKADKECLEFFPIEEGYSEQQYQLYPYKNDFHTIADGPIKFYFFDSAFLAWYYHQTKTESQKELCEKVTRFWIHQKVCEIYLIWKGYKDSEKRLKTWLDSYELPDAEADEIYKDKIDVMEVSEEVRQLYLLSRQEVFKRHGTSRLLNERGIYVNAFSSRMPSHLESELRNYLANPDFRLSLKELPPIELVSLSPVDDRIDFDGVTWLHLSEKSAIELIEQHKV